MSLQDLLNSISNGQSKPIENAVEKENDTNVKVPSSSIDNKFNMMGNINTNRDSMYAAHDEPARSYNILSTDPFMRNLISGELKDENLSTSEVAYVNEYKDIIDSCDKIIALTSETIEDIDPILSKKIRLVKDGKYMKNGVREINELVNTKTSLINALQSANKQKFDIKHNAHKLDIQRTKSIKPEGDESGSIGVVTALLEKINANKNSAPQRKAAMNNIERAMSNKKYLASSIDGQNLQNVDMQNSPTQENLQYRKEMESLDDYDVVLFYDAQTKKKWFNARHSKTGELNPAYSGIPSDEWLRDTRVDMINNRGTHSKISGKHYPLVILKNENNELIKDDAGERQFDPDAI